MRFEASRQLRYMSLRVIMAHCPPGCLPHMFLRIEIRRSCWKHHELEAWISRHHVSYLTTVPRCSVP